MTTRTNHGMPLAMQKRGERLPFLLNKRYHLFTGETVVIIGRTHHKRTCVEGSDELWRWDTDTSPGRLTGTDAEAQHPLSLIPQYRFDEIH